MNKTPKLRFKEFSGDWESKYGENIAEKITKGSSPKWQGFNYQSEGVLFVTSENVRDGYLDVSEPKYLPLEFNDKQKSSSLLKGDLLINIVGASIGRMCEFNLDNVVANVNQAVCVFRLKDKSTKKFINYHLQTNKTKKVLSGTQTESARPNLSLADIRGLEFNIPKSKEEQDKIASFFSLIDDKISLQGEKVEALKDYKRGMMQKIFSRELRFKDDDGRGYPEWEEKKLGDIGFFKTSSVDKLINENEEIVYLVNYMDVYKHIDINKDAITNLMQVSAKDAQIENNNLIKGDILFTPSSETPDDIGHSIVIFEDLPKTLYSYHLVRFRPSIKLNLLYSHYFCNIDSVRSQIVKFATGSTRFTVSINEFSQVKVNIPSYDEQKKIGAFLNNIDRKLKKEQEKLDSLNEYKKGLLQQMFI